MMDYFLSGGSHKTAANGRCAMEWVSYLAGEPHTDKPVCVDPVLTRFCIAFNDGLPDEKRQRLRPYLARTIGTRDDGLSEQRAWMCADWLVCTYVPAWLSLAQLDETAERLRSLAPVTAKSLPRATDVLSAARSEAGAAWVAAGDAAWDAARAAAWVAAGVAAGDAAGDAARDAAWVAAGDAAEDAARDAARAAAWVAAGDAAEDAARAAAWAAAWVAAWDALRPTANALQDSAFGLLDRMLPTEVIRLPVVEDAEQVCGVALA